MQHRTHLEDHRRELAPVPRQVQARASLDPTDLQLYELAAVGLGASDLLDVVAGFLQVGTNGDSHGAWSSWLRGEQVDVHRRPLDQAVGEEGVSSSESEAMGTGRGQSDAGDILLERVEPHRLGLGHEWTGTSSSQPGVALLPGCSYHRREVELGPQLHQGVTLEPSREVLDAARFQQHHPVHQLA